MNKYDWRVTSNHSTHYDDCGCLTEDRLKRIEELKAEVSKRDAIIEGLKKKIEIADEAIETILKEVGSDNLPLSTFARFNALEAQRILKSNKSGGSERE